MENGKMRAAVLREFGKPLLVEEMEIPVPGVDEVLVKIRASGLCVTDLHIQDGIIKSVQLPYIPGHEMAGVVVALGERLKNPHLKVGQHVVCGVDIVCGICSLCRMGRENLCRSRVRVGFERNGSHGEYAVVPSRNLFPIADDVPFEQAAILPDAVACMYHAIHSQAVVTRGTKVLFYGCGGLALQGVQIAKHLGAEVYAAARTDAKLEKARELGSTYTINTRRENLEERIFQLTEGEQCDVIFDLVGHTDTPDELLRCLRPGGKLIALAYAEPNFRLNCQELVIKEKEILGLRGSTRQDLIDSIALVEQGVIAPYVSAAYRLEQINEALEDLRACRGLGRSVLLFDE